ncbi:FkbM family methyltransferase [Gammaproteobacteria bacterium]|jgi:FkbM family methyltransferase|nr:FkbM family methyltransferase [Gammaproteobacteria bacterium]
MKIFLDIGSHVGETLIEVTKEKYSFDKIFCFEPSIYCMDDLKKFSDQDDRISICPFGLSNQNQDAELFQPGSLGGTIVKGEIHDVGKEHDPTFRDDRTIEKIKLRDANEWCEENLNSDDFIVVKTNCEGSEVDILDSLIDGKFMKNIYSFLVTFDIREHKEFQHREIEIRKKLKHTGLTNFCFSDDVMIGHSHIERIANWLRLFGIDSSEKDLGVLKQNYRKVFLKYSSKSGFFTRWEIRLKRIVNYKNLPLWLKKTLSFFKRILGLNRER